METSAKVPLLDFCHPETPIRFVLRGVGMYLPSVAVAGPRDGAFRVDLPTVAAARDGYRRQVREERSAAKSKDDGLFRGRLVQRDPISHLTAIVLGAFFVIQSAAADPLTPAHYAMAAAYSRSHGGLVLYIRQGGKVVYEDYYRGFSANTPHKIYSGTKSFVAVTALLAQQDGLLTLDEKASKTLTEWQGDRRRDITIDQLLSQTSGLNPDGEPIDSAHDQFAAAVHVHLIDPPGARFHYGAAGYQAFGEILKRKLQPLGKTVEGYMRERLLNPLDIDVYDWKHDEAGNPLVHAGMLLSAKQWAKFGEFIAQGGEIHKKQLVDAQLFSSLFIGHNANPAYGLGFWLNAPQPSDRDQRMLDLLPAADGDQIYPGGPSDIYTGMGSYKQRLYVIPSLDLVIVRFAYSSPFSDGDFLSRLLTGHPKPDAHTH